ncbi:hypothetical protein [Staphylococcus debuckii]|uniref:DUF3021 domain-containing protein n=1 Tax=Staphylococcus debuckii TaxID=2044912 RepID=A0ABU9EV32_9STAP
MKILYHIIAILVLSTFLYLFFVISDTLGTHHSAELLMNIDFLPGFRHAGFFSSLLFHLGTTTAVYIAFQCIKNSYFYPIGIIISIIMFGMLYPFLITMSVRSMFVFSWGDYAIWMLGHILFLVLIDLSLRFEKNFTHH